MKHDFQEGEKVLFYKNDYTNEYYGMTSTMNIYMEEKMTLVVRSVYQSSRVRCSLEGETGTCSYHFDDLRRVFNPDEEYLEGLMP